MEIWWWDSSSSCTQGICWSPPPPPLSPLLNVREENCSIHFPLPSKNKVEPLTPSSTITAIIFEIQIFLTHPRPSSVAVENSNSNWFFCYFYSFWFWFWAHSSVAVLQQCSGSHTDVENFQLSNFLSPPFPKCNQFICKDFQCWFALQVQHMTDGRPI